MHFQSALENLAKSNIFAKVVSKVPSQMISFNQSQRPLEVFNVKRHFIGLAPKHHEVSADATNYIIVHGIGGWRVTNECLVECACARVLHVWKQ